MRFLNLPRRNLPRQVTRGVGSVAPVPKNLLGLIILPGKEPLTGRLGKNGTNKCELVKKKFYLPPLHKNVLALSELDLCPNLGPTVK